MDGESFKTLIKTWNHPRTANTNLHGVLCGVTEIFKYKCPLGSIAGFLMGFAFIQAHNVIFPRSVKSSDFINFNFNLIVLTNNQMQLMWLFWY